MFQDVCDFGDAFVFEGFEGVDFGGRPDVLMVVVVVLDALGTEGLDAGGGRAEVGVGLALVFHAGVLDMLGGQLGGVKIGVVAIFHLNLTIILNCLK